jgi:hypothetical protein
MNWSGRSLNLIAQQHDKMKDDIEILKNPRPKSLCGAGLGFLTSIDILSANAVITDSFLQIVIFEQKTWENSAKFLGNSHTYYCKFYCKFNHIFFFRKKVAKVSIS